MAALDIRMRRVRGNTAEIRQGMAGKGAAAKGRKVAWDISNVRKTATE
jgi:hypothetical protein